MVNTAVLSKETTVSCRQACSAGFVLFE